MTGPEPGDLAELEWEYVSGTAAVPSICYRMGSGCWRRVSDWLRIQDYQVQAVRPLSVVPTDSLEGLLKMIETHGSMTPRPIRDATAAVRSAITKEES